MNICSSLVSERESVPRFRYGPYRPFCAVISSPVFGSTPTTRGNDSSFSASSSVTVSRFIDRSSEPVRGLGPLGFLPFLAGALSSGSLPLPPVVPLPSGREVPQRSRPLDAAPAVPR